MFLNKMENRLATLYLEKWNPEQRVIGIQYELAKILLDCQASELVELTTEIFRWMESLMDRIGWAPWPMRYSAWEIYAENSGLSHSPHWRNSLESAYFDLRVLPKILDASETDVRFPRSPRIAGACLAAEVITGCVHAARTLVWAKESPENAQRSGLGEYPVKGMDQYPEATLIVYQAFKGIVDIMKKYGLNMENRDESQDVLQACEFYRKNYC